MITLIDLLNLHFSILIFTFSIAVGLPGKQHPSIFVSPAQGWTVKTPSIGKNE